MKVCNYWTAGTCRQDKNCWFLHRKPVAGEACSAQKAKPKGKPKAKPKGKSRQKGHGLPGVLEEEEEEQGEEEQDETAHGFPAMSPGPDQSGYDEAEEEEEETGGWTHPQDWEEEDPDYDWNNNAWQTDDYDWNSEAWNTESEWWRNDESTDWGESPWEQSGSW